MRARSARVELRYQSVWLLEFSCFFFDLHGYFIILFEYDVTQKLIIKLL